MINSNQICVAEETETEKDLEEVVEDICKHLTDKDYTVPEYMTEFFESQGCVDFLGEYFDESVLRETDCVIYSSASYYNLENWVKRVIGFFNDVRGWYMPAGKVKELMDGKPKYDVLNLLAERQTIISARKEHSTRALDISQLLYKVSPPQFEKVLTRCKDTDDFYFGALNRNI